MKNLFLYVSAFIPMYALIGIKLIVELINKNLSFNVLNCVILFTIIAMTAIGIIGVYWNIGKTEASSIEIVILSQKNITDQHFLGYFSLFVLFALSFDLSKISMFVVYCVVLALIGIVYLKNNLYYINPFLNILGFNFYDITYKEVGSDETRHAKIFYRGILQTQGTTFWVKMKNDNFSFVDKAKMKSTEKK